MKSAEDIIGILADHIGGVYERPMGFARDLGRLDALLYGYHALWAAIMDKIDDFSLALMLVQVEEGSEPNVTLRFDDICARNDQLKDEEDRLRHFLGLWRQVSDRLGAPIRDHYKAGLTLRSAKGFEIFRRYTNNDKP